MELSSGQQRLLFVVVVLLLAGLGIYLVGPGSHHGATASPSPTQSASAAASAPAAGVPPATVPAPTPSGTGGGADIYQWLPFTQQDLTAAARTTVAFAAAYDTWSYTEPAPAYAGKMAGLATTSLAAALQNAYATPGVAQLRSAEKQVANGSGEIVSIRSFGANSIMFVVDITQKLAKTTGTSTSTQQYWVTVVSDPAGWQVDNIEPTGAGNQ